MVGRTLFILLLLSILPLTSFAQQITVAAAANVQFPLEDLGVAFTHQTGIDVKTVIGSSGQLTAQIEHGAPFDIFMSADMKYPEALYKKGFSRRAPQIYARGVLVLWTMKDNLKLSSDLKFFRDDQIKKIALANPQQAPYGRGAMDALKFYKIYDQVQGKIVWGENIAQTNQFIMTQAADIGFTAASVVVSPNIKAKGHWVAVDTASYKPIDQGAIVLQYGQKHHPSGAQAFYDFLFSPSAQAIFKKYGYKVL